jgi:hypothetical protein
MQIGLVREFRTVVRGGVWRKEVLGRLFGTIGGHIVSAVGRINVGVEIGLGALGRFAWV